MKNIGTQRIETGVARSSAIQTTLFPNIESKNCRSKSVKEREHKTSRHPRHCNASEAVPRDKLQTPLDQFQNLERNRPKFRRVAETAVASHADPTLKCCEVSVPKLRQFGSGSWWNLASGFCLCATAVVHGRGHIFNVKTRSFPCVVFVLNEIHFFGHFPRDPCR